MRKQILTKALLMLIGVGLLLTPLARADEPWPPKPVQAPPHVEDEGSSARVKTGMVVDSAGMAPNLAIAAVYHNDWDRRGSDTLSSSALETSAGFDLEVMARHGEKKVGFDASVSLLTFGHVHAHALHETEYSRQVAEQLAYELNDYSDKIAAKQHEIATADPEVVEYRRAELKALTIRRNLLLEQLRSDGYAALERDGRSSVRPAKDEASRRFDFRVLTVGGVYRNDPVLATRQYGARLEVAATSFDVAGRVLGLNTHLCGALVPVVYVAGESQGRGDAESLATICAGVETGIGKFDFRVSGETDWIAARKVEEALELKPTHGGGPALYVSHIDETANGKAVSRNLTGVIYVF